MDLSEIKRFPITSDIVIGAIYIYISGNCRNYGYF